MTDEKRVSPDSDEYMRQVRDAINGALQTVAAAAPDAIAIDVAACLVTAGMEISRSAGMELELANLLRAFAAKLEATPKPALD